MGRFFFFIYFRKIVSKENEMHIVRINVHDEIKSIRIWPTASKAYVYEKKKIRSVNSWENLYYSCKCSVGLWVKLQFVQG